MREDLYSKTNRYTVPCLFINDNPMHESSLIIDWLKQYHNELEKDKWKEKYNEWADNYKHQMF